MATSKKSNIWFITARGRRAVIWFTTYRAINKNMAKTMHIVFTAGVYAQQASKLRAALTRAVNDKYEEVYILISSNGGDVTEGLSIAALIKALPFKTIMHNIGQVDSVATAIFSAGSERVSNQNSSFMFHGVTMNMKENSLLEQQLKELHTTSIRMKTDIAKAISTYTNVPFADVEALMIDGGSILTSNEAKARGLISEIREAQIPQNATIIEISNV